MPNAKKGTEVARALQDIANAGIALQGSLSISTQIDFVNTTVAIFHDLKDNHGDDIEAAYPGFIARVDAELSPEYVEETIQGILDGQ
jgi:hypothetical protein